MHNRRHWLWNTGTGIGGLALSSLLQADRRRAHAGSTERPQHSDFMTGQIQAQRVIEIFCPGGLSHVDTWDYKPQLIESDGKEFDPELGKQTFAGVAGKLAKSFWTFRQHGEAGRWMSDLFPNLAKHVDDLAFIHSMQSKSALHGPAMFMMNSGFPRPGFPAMGAWISYGLGSENENLPTYVVLPDPRGLPPGGVLNWGAGFLPAMHQGTVIEVASQGPPIRDLYPADQRPLPLEEPSRALLRLLNERHRAERPDATMLDARIAAFEMAARLQLSAPDAISWNQESAATQGRYAVEDPDAGPFGRQCLLARRLVERGVRFVQIFCGAENTSKLKVRPNWDSHEDIVRDHGYWGRVLDIGASALLADLKERGLLDSTLVICTTEFGRQPFMQGQQKGRDHNPGAFTAWMAGGGIRGGTAHGESDPVGFQAIEPTYCYDLHATALHLLGIDHEKLTFYHNGIQRRLTDVHGHVLHSILK